MSEEYEGWAILELMGHRRLAGHVSTQEIAGAPMLRIDVYAGDQQEPVATQFYSAPAIYCLTPSTEDLCRRFGLRIRPMPVHAYELPAPSSTTAGPGGDFESDDEGGWDEHDDEVAVRD